MKNKITLAALVVFITTSITNIFGSEFGGLSDKNSIVVHNQSKWSIELKPLAKKLEVHMMPRDGVIPKSDPKRTFDAALGVPWDWTSFPLQIKSQNGFTKKFKVRRPDRIKDERTDYDLFVKVDAKGIQASIAAREYYWDASKGKTAFHLIEEIKLKEIE